MAELTVSFCKLNACSSIFRYDTVNEILGCQTLTVNSVKVF